MYKISILISKITRLVINLLNVGSGYTWPGHIVLKLFPNTLKNIKHKLPKRVIVISGTNGKTTTVKLLKHILENNGLKVLSNETGANLINGVVSSILLNSKVNGLLEYDLAIFELDELNLAEFLKVVKPNTLALLNLSRDQLDRYWEKEIILEKWKEAISFLNEDTLLVLEQNQKLLKVLSTLHSGSTAYFNDNREHLKNTNLMGEFNAKNINCALLIAETLGISNEEASQSLSSFKYAYGRGEELNYKNKNFRVLLAKNPESLNQNLSLLLEGELKYDSIFYILNDNIPDGRDVSWIFDTNPDMLGRVNKGKHVYVSGTRALDMAVRLEYAGSDIDQHDIDSKLINIVNKIIENKNTKNVIVLPNYSAMLNFRELILGRRIL